MNKSTYITIPDAPNYEINGYLKVRNKTTGAILKGERRPHRNVVIVSIRTPNGRIRRSAAVLYRNALDALSATIWQPIFSLDKKYELSPGGAVRNRKTKKLIKPINCNGKAYYVLRGNNKYVNKSLRQLMNEVYFTHISRKRPPIKTQASKDGKTYHFESIKACAEFLANHISYSGYYLRALLAKRPRELFGWSLKFYGGAHRG